MKTTVEIGKTYALRSEAGGEVTDVDGKTLDTLEPNKQVHMTAQESEWLVPDDCKVTKTTFNYALAALGLLGGGDKLPAGYTRLEFLESTGTQYIKTGLPATNLTCVEVDFGDMTSSGWSTPVASLTSYGGAAYALFAKGSQGATYDVPRFDYGSSIVVAPKYNVSVGRHVMRKEAHRNFIDGAAVTANAKSGTATWAELCLLYFLSLGTFMSCKLYSYKHWKLGGAVQQHFIPALDPNGKPCMFDRVSKQPFWNSGSGSFIAGVGTVAQLTGLLRNLPATGGKLTLSLPAEANTPEVAEQLQACYDTKGWTLTVHEYRPAAVATYSLRRVREIVWCSPSPCEHGSYVDNFGTRWQIDRCAAIFGPHGQDPTAYGYTPFDSVEAAAEQWGLVPYVEPETEENAD